MSHEDLLTGLERHGDFVRAATETVRGLILAGEAVRGRTFSQALQQYGGTRDAGDLCVAIVLCRERLWAHAWQWFTRSPQPRVLELAAEEYLSVAFRVDRTTATRALDAVVGADGPIRADACSWFEIAKLAFAVGAEKQSLIAVDRAETALPELADAARVAALQLDVAWLRRWYGKTSSVGASPAPGEVAIAVFGYRHPDRDAASRDLGDYLESVALLGHLARRASVALTGDADVVAVVERARTRLADASRIVGDDATARLYVVDRDAARSSDAPNGTWLLAAGTITKPIYELRLDLPLPATLQPIFVSLHVDSTERLTADVVDHLKRHGPIGCRDWYTTYLLLAAGVDAFFAGGVAATADLIAGGGPDESRSGRLCVDAEPGEPGKAMPQTFPEVRERAVAANLDDALERIAQYQRAAHVDTSRLQTYLAARAVGTPVDFHPPNRASMDLYGLFNIGDAQFEAMRAAMVERISAVLSTILSGAGKDEVYEHWRALCADDVRAAKARLHDVPALPALNFDIDAVCADVRAHAVAVARTAPAPPGEEINVELSLDANYLTQLTIVLDSIITHASRPVRAFVLCRDLDERDFDWLAALFPTVAFLFLPTDRIQFPFRGLLSHTTVITMDRLLLPELLPEVPRIVHHDLDALCLADLAELYDCDLQGAPIAARTASLPKSSRAFAWYSRKAQQFSGRPQIGRELIRRTHSRHRFDFPVLNAGIMVLDLAMMRADGFCREFLPWVARYDMNDQDVLNAYAGSRRVEIPAGWNWRPRLEPMDEPKIAHWAGPFKPWSEPWLIGKDLWQTAERRLHDRCRQLGVPSRPTHRVSDG